MIIFKFRYSTPSENETDVFRTQKSGKAEVIYRKNEQHPIYRLEIMIELPVSDRERLRDVVDMHLHMSPDLFERPFDEIDMARQARDVGYKAVLFKCHFAMNADRVQFVRKIVPGIEAFGSVVLNHFVGGLNPMAVEAAIGFGAKEVWMPTLHAANHIKAVGAPTLTTHTRLVKETTTKEVKGITIFGSGGDLLPQVHEILDLIADADIILGTGHLSLKEDYALLKAAKNHGVEKILVTHPEEEGTTFSIEDQVKLADAGAFIEHDFLPCMPRKQRFDPKLIVDAIKKVSATRCIMATDMGQLWSPHPIEGMRQFIRTMLSLGIDENEIGIMTKKNPALLLNLT